MPSSTCGRRQGYLKARAKVGSCSTAETRWETWGPEACKKLTWVVRSGKGSRRTPKQ